MKRLPFLIPVLILIASAGCTSPGPTRAAYTVCEIPFASRASIVGVAAKSVREQGFQVARMDAAQGIVETDPIETEEMETARPVSGVLGRTRRVRRVASVEVRPADEAVTVFCKVEIQEYVTDARRFYAREHAISDTPTETPAALEAATSAEQNATWRVFGRDRELERKILDGIVQLAAPPTR